MRRFLLVTTAFVLWLAGLVVGLPGYDNYNPYLDDWVPERYSTLDEASYDAGFTIPALHNAPGWRIETIFVGWRGDRGLIDLTYKSDGGALLTLSINKTSKLPPFIKANEKEDEVRNEERVRFGGRYARLVTYDTPSVQVMTTGWTHDRRPISATAFVYPNTPLSKQQFLDVLETVH